MKTHVRKDAGRPAPTPSLYVEGRLEYRSFQDEEGKERGVCEISAGDVLFLGRRSSDAASPSALSTADNAPAAEVELEDMPF